MKTSAEMFRLFIMRAFLQLASFDLSKISTVHHAAVTLTRKNRAQFPRQPESQHPDHSIIIHPLIPPHATQPRNLSHARKITRTHTP